MRSLSETGAWYSAPPQIGKADARRGQLVGVPLEGQTVDGDGALVGATADVGVGGQGDADVEAPAPAGADLGEEALHVGLDLVGHVAGQDRLEVLPRQTVLAFQEEGAGQLQAHADEVRIVDQHGVEGGDRLVEQGIAAILVRLVAKACSTAAMPSRNRASRSCAAAGRASRRIRAATRLRMTGSRVRKRKPRCRRDVNTGVKERWEGRRRPS